MLIIFFWVNLVCRCSHDVVSIETSCLFAARLLNSGKKGMKGKQVNEKENTFSTFLKKENVI